MAGRMLEAGHEIGLHGYSHACMENMSPEKLEWELSKTEALCGNRQEPPPTCFGRLEGKPIKP